MKEKKHFKSFILVINLQEMSFHLCPYIKTASNITGMGRNTMSKITKLRLYKHFVIVPVKEEV
jgi:hypothetical protein